MLARRLHVLLLGLVMVTAITASAIVVYQFDQKMLDVAVTELDRKSAVQKTRFITEIEELRRDLGLLAATPPIQGIARARRTAVGIDPVDGSSLDVWKERLAETFAATLTVKPDYLQLRYIAADTGRELVRVDRRKGEIVTVRELQDKSEEDYFEQSLRLAAGEIYLSPMSLNREYGEIEMPPRPVLRASTPVPDPGGGPHSAFLILNIDLRRALGRLTLAEEQVYVTNPVGQYVFHPDESRSFEFQLGSNAVATADFPELTEILDDEKSSSRLVVGRLSGDIMKLERASYGPGADDFIGVVTQGKRPDLVRSALGVVVPVALATLLPIGWGAWLIRRFTRPISALTAAVRSMESDELELPKNLSGEAADLGVAIDDALRSLRKRTAELERTNQELEQFAYIASHDLQEPARTMASMAAVLEEQVSDQLNERAKRCVQFISESSTRMLALIRGFLVYNRIGRETARESVDVGVVVNEVLDDLAEALEESGARIEVGELPKAVSASPLELRLLFQNLLSNAVKFVRPETPPEVEIRCLHQGGRVVYEVSDNGPGIPLEGRERVFAMYRRHHRRDEFDGHGIGLAHCRKIVEAHGGEIWIEESSTGGTRLRFTLGEEEVARAA